MTSVVVSPLEFKVVVDEQTNEIVVSAPGPQGPQGVQGVQGEKGERGDLLTYVHSQESASDTWVIQHGLGAFLNVTVVDSAGTTVEGDVTYDDLNTITIRFTSQFAGTAYVS